MLVMKIMLTITMTAYQVHDKHDKYDAANYDNDYLP